MPILGAAPQSSSPNWRQDGPVSATVPGARQVILPPFVPANVPVEGQDTLFIATFTDERAILAEGARLNRDPTLYTVAGTKKGALAAAASGSWRGAVVPATGVGDQYYVPADGLLSVDEFTVRFTLTSVGADISALAQGGTGSQDQLLQIGTGTDKLLIYRAGTGPGNLMARFRTLNTVDNAEQPTVALTAGRIPADTPTPIWVTWDGTTLTLTIGNNTATASATVVNTKPLWRPSGGNVSAGSGLTVLGNIDSNMTVSAGIKVEDVTIYRYARTYSTTATKKVTAPTVTVDVTNGTAGAWKPRLLGVYGHYTGYRQTTADAPTAISLAQFAAAAAVGALPRIGISHVIDRAVITDTGGGTFTYDWTGVTRGMDAMVAANPNIRFGVELGFCPAYQNASPTAVPSDNTKFAKNCADFLRYCIDVKHYTLDTVALWDEPDSGSSGAWTGTQGQYQTMWQAVRSKLAADVPEVTLGTPTLAYNPASGTDYLTPILSYCQTNSLPLGAVVLDDYTGDLSTLRYRIRLVKASLASYGLSSTPINIDGWNLPMTDIRSYPGSLTRGAAEHRTEVVAGFTLAYIDTALAEAVDAAMIYTLASKDDLYGEQDFGLLDQNARPLPAFATFQALGKLGGTRVAATSNWPNLHQVATINGDVITLVYGSYRRWRPADDQHIAFTWTGLPAAFTWQHWQFDRRHVTSGQLVQVAQGTEADLPLGARLGINGVGCFRIVPT